MTTLTGAPVTSTQPTLMVTVPNGVTTNMGALFTVATADGNDWDPVPASAGASFTLLDDRAATNMRVTLWAGTGLAAGAPVDFVGSVATQATVNHVYSDEWAPRAAGIAPAIRSGSSAVCVSGSVAAESGGVVLLVSLERTTATGTTVVSAVSSGGEPVTTVSFAEATGTVTSTLVARFTASASAARTGTVTYSSGSGNGYAALILTDVPAAPVGPEVGYVATGGGLETGHAYVVGTGGELEVPVEVRGFSPGYASVTAMLASPVFRIAHRGGSADWPEMTAHAYTQAVWWGAGALEISVGITSDGVLFGLHDETLDRTSGTTGWDPRTHTWAEVQAFTVAPPDGSSTVAGKPYARLTDLLDLYTDRVVFVDPKYLNLSQRAALLQVMASKPNAVDRFVWKYFGTAENIAAQGKSAGFTTWGYFYEADDYVASAASWDILGMDYSASAGTWTAITALGKPVIGHVVTTANQANQAVARGAVGLMCAGVKAIIPRA